MAAGCDASLSTEDSAAAPNGRRTARPWLPIACRRKTHIPTASAYKDGDDQLLKIDIATGAATCVRRAWHQTDADGFAAGRIGYLRRDKTLKGVFYGMGAIGPTGADLRTPSWFPDGRQVVYSRFAVKTPIKPVEMWSRNPKYELYMTAWSPDYDRSGEHLAVTSMVSPGTTSLFIVDKGQQARPILTRKETIMAPSWSPDGKQIAVSIGKFPGFGGTRWATQIP